MAQAKKINALTLWFLQQYKFLKENGRIPLDKELADIMGFKKANELSNILNKSYNLKPEKLERFCKHFDLERPSDFSDVSEKGAPLNDTKESILGMLKMALAANVDHAAANKENASANSKHASSLEKLIALLGVNLSSGDTDEISESFQEESESKPGPVGHMEDLLGKPEIHLNRKKKVQRENIVSEKRK